MHGEHCIARERIEQAVFEHFLRAGLALFSRLENQIQCAVEGLSAGQMLGRREQHRGMAVVTARVHLAGERAGIRQAGLFVDRQGVHVRAQAEALRAVAHFQLADHTGFPEPACHRVAPFLQTLGHEVGGGEFFVRQFRVGVDTVAQSDHFVFEIGDARRDGHGVHVAVSVCESVNA